MVSKKTEFEITCGIVCTCEFLTQFWRRERTECDGCQKGVNSIALEQGDRRISAG